MLSISNEVGNRIRQYRKSLGMSQETLALNAGLTVSFLGDIERGNKKPTVESLEKLLRALDVPFAKFFDYEAVIKQAENNSVLENLYLLLRNRSDDEVEMVCSIVKQILEYGDARAANHTP